MSRRLRELVLERDGYTCLACGDSWKVKRWIELHVDHIVPVCGGGSNDIWNLQTLCRDCNIRKGGTLHIELADDL